MSVDAGVAGRRGCHYERGLRRCCSSVVEHSLGKGEVESSIPSSSIGISLKISGLANFGDAISTRSGAETNARTPTARASRTTRLRLHPEADTQQRPAP
jgi:hypothetical protein